MLRLLVFLSVLAVTGCGGASLTPGPTPTQPLELDQETAQLWAEWATEARQIASLTAQMYGSGTMLPAQAAQQQERAEMLAEEIRSTQPSNELVLKLADDLDRLAGPLGFGVQYAENAGLSVIRIVLPGLEDALSQLSEDATAVSEMLEAE